MAFDPNELRRRRMLQMNQLQPMGGGENEWDSPPQYEALSGGDEEDISQDNEADVAVKPANAKLSEAQLNYRKALGEMPNAQNFQPSRGRRIMAAVAGGLAGIRDPRMGYQLGSEIAHQPYNEALEGWKRGLGPLEENVKLDTEAQKQEIAGRRASAYERGATAREKAASATEAWRKDQASRPRKWEPTTKEEATEFEKSKHAPPAPRGWQPATMDEYKQVHPPPRGPQPTAFDQFQADPAGYTRFKKAGQRPLQGRAPHVFTPQQQTAAEKSAIMHVAQQNQGFSKFVDPKTGLAVSIDSVMNPGGFMGIGGASPSEISLRRDLYHKFLSEIDKKKKEILGSQQQTGGPAWNIEQEEDDE